MKLFTWVQKLKAHYFWYAKELWGTTTLNWVDWVLQKPNNETNENKPKSPSRKKKVSWALTMVDGQAVPEMGK